MPYIQPEKRPAIDHEIERLAKILHTKGEVNYAITRLLCSLVTLPITYTGLSNARSVLLDVYDEFTRKVINPYEDAAEAKNGPVHAMGRKYEKEVAEHIL